MLAKISLLFFAHNVYLKMYQAYIYIFKLYLRTFVHLYSVSVPSLADLLWPQPLIYKTKVFHRCFLTELSVWGAALPSSHLFLNVSLSLSPPAPPSICASFLSKLFVLLHFGFSWIMCERSESLQLKKRDNESLHCDDVNMRSVRANQRGCCPSLNHSVSLFPSSSASDVVCEPQVAVNNNLGIFRCIILVFLQLCETWNRTDSALKM